MMSATTINDILHDDISKLSCTLTPPGFRGDARTLRIVQEILTKAIDALGAESSNAQGLSRVITTADKLRQAPSHLLYLLKDSLANGGKGQLIGLLKVGRKRLYLFDERDKTVEVEPLCVLDFFVRGERQRHGYGRRLFDYMLQDTGTNPMHMAVDGPSSKMEQFLTTAYGIQNLVKQSNNFAVAPEFFTTGGGSGNSSGRSSPAPAPIGRYAATRPQSVIGTVIHGASSSHTNNSNCTPASEPEEPDYAPGAAAAVDRDSGKVENEAPPSRERPTTLHVEAAEVAPSARAAGRTQVSPAGSRSRQDSQLTDRGYFDVKFYHNKLW